MKAEEIEKKVRDTLKKIGISKKDKILIALSGGKDSAVTAFLLKKLGYNIEGFHIDLGIGKYSEECLKKTEELCENLKIKLHKHIVKEKKGVTMCYIRAAIKSFPKYKKLNNCAICGVIKKDILNKEARRLKAEYLATGHNLDDELQTFLINLFKGSLKLSANLGPITKGKENKKFIPRIKPLYYIPEKEVLKYSKIKKLPVNEKKCPCAQKSYRIETRTLLEKYKPKEKIQMLENFVKFMEKLNIKRDKIKYCKICREPSQRDICKNCELLGVINQKVDSKIYKKTQ